MSVEDIEARLEKLHKYRLGSDYLDRFPDLIGGVTAEQVMEVAARRLHPDRCVVAVAGPYPEADAAVRPDTAAGGEDSAMVPMYPGHSPFGPPVSSPGSSGLSESYI